MGSSYNLRIIVDSNKYPLLTTILGVEPTPKSRANKRLTTNTATWELVISEYSQLYAEAIDYFLNLLRDKAAQLEQIGVSCDSTTIWYLYEYEGQCNMEFHPIDLKRMGDLGITLCISCWEKD